MQLANFCTDIHDLPFFSPASDPWDILLNIESELSNLAQSLGGSESYIHPDTVIEHGVTIKPPVVISSGVFIASGAYLRGGVFLGKNSSIGPGSEVKTSIILRDSSLAHFNFVGNSIIGSHVNFEAGAVIANHWNERSDKSISVLIGSELIHTGLTKFGAVVGDACKVGANSVLSPGTLLNPDSVIPRLTLIEQRL
jgi:UDP-N-acetylglucosamine diphosphorylase / glucose-1-phosphate thymidylyltransferase / UDP-N-acetylgalactosamine diphosphorylase / glucosamine-1-phosphate N-acetyltransferase / galactosamine-1-phosphate N-acetyltransferase